MMRKYNKQLFQTLFTNAPGYMKPWQNNDWKNGFIYGTIFGLIWSKLFKCLE